MRLTFLILLVLLVGTVCAGAQTTAPYPYPTGMRVVTGGQSVLARSAPNTSGTCGTPPHVCTQADLLLPGTFGVVLADAPVLDAAGWYWERITYDTGVTGWSTAVAPYLNMTVPPQMIQGAGMSVGGSYAGPVLTQATCIKDGLTSAATMQLQSAPPIDAIPQEQGMLICPWGTPGLGNHIAVITAINPQGSSPSTEFQFAVTAAPTVPPPTVPGNLRIAALP